MIVVARLRRGAQGGGREAGGGASKTVRSQAEPGNERNLGHRGLSKNKKQLRKSVFHVLYYE